MTDVTLLLSLTIKTNKSSLNSQTMTSFYFIPLCICFSILSINFSTNSNGEIRNSKFTIWLFFSFFSFFLFGSPSNALILGFTPKFGGKYLALIPGHSNPTQVLDSDIGDNYNYAILYPENKDNEYLKTLKMIQKRSDTREGLSLQESAMPSLSSGHHRKLEKIPPNNAQPTNHLSLYNLLKTILFFRHCSKRPSEDPTLQLICFSFSEILVLRSEVEGPE